MALLAAASRVEFYAVGQYSVVADDAQYKFLRFGFSSGAFTDTRLQPLATCLAPLLVAAARRGGIAANAMASCVGCVVMMQLLQFVAHRSHSCVAAISWRAMCGGRVAESGEIL